MADVFMALKLKVVFFIVLLSKFSAGCPPECKCGHQKVDCSNRQLDTVPKFGPELQRSVYVDLRTNSLEELKRGSFQHLHKTQTLILQFNMIKNIDEGTFANMSALKTLDLSGNQFKSLPQGIFKPLTKLHSLDLSQNYLTNVDGVLSSLTSLYRLDLGHNNLAALTDTTFPDLQGLMYLMLGNNRLSDISTNAFSPLTKLSYLVLKNNPLYIVDNKFVNNRRMSYVDLTNCKLQTIPKGLPWVLRYLQLTQNNIIYINKASLKAYNYVAVVVLDQNKIQSVEPGAFSHMVYLRQLWMNGNKLTSIPEQLPLGLHFLYLDANNIQSLHEDIFTDRSKLLTFSVKGNQLHHISAKHFNKMSDVTKLYLDNNNLTEIEDFTFKSLGKLQKLFISRNPLKKLSRYSLFGLRQLKFLELAFVTTDVDIDDMIFSKTPNLSTLELQYSSDLAQKICNSQIILKTLTNLTDLNLMSAELSTLSPLLQEELPNLEQLQLADNKWHCDKALLWLNHWMRLAKTLFVNKMDVKCFSPLELRGKVISSLFDSQFVPVTTTTMTTVLSSTRSDQQVSSTPLQPLTTVSSTSPPVQTTTQHQPQITTQVRTPAATTTVTSKEPKITSAFTTGYRRHDITTKTQKVAVATTITTTTTEKTTTMSHLQRTTSVFTRTGRFTKTMPTKYRSVKKSPLFTSTQHYTITTEKGSAKPNEVPRITTPKPSSLTITHQVKTTSAGDTELTTVFSLPENSSSSILADSENLQEEEEEDSGTITAIATSISVILLLIILIIIGYLVFRYRRNRLIYHRAIHYQQHSDMMYFITVSESETKPIKGTSRSERGSVSSVTSHDITNEEGGIKVYHWDGEQ
ncbi:leucine-rich repeat-containing protein 15-like [Liolophura sinensis]|uniref:leucine-rich repeat-containing protein 15-like n=1 Tax=Liolophura sinensis TaxID=3198878 RepID=UPI003158EFE7